MTRVAMASALLAVQAAPLAGDQVPLAADPGLLAGVGDRVTGVGDRVAGVGEEPRWIRSSFVRRDGEPANDPKPTAAELCISTANLI